MILADSVDWKILKSNLKTLLKLLNLSKEELCVELGVGYKTVENWISERCDYGIQQENYEKLVRFLKKECYILYGTENGISVAFDNYKLDLPDIIESIIQHRIDKK